MMPIQNCSSEGKPGFKWGDAGKCYTYTEGNESSRKDARKKAIAQGIAMGDIVIKGEIGIEQDYMYFLENE